MTTLITTQTNLLSYIKENLIGDANLTTRGMEALCGLSNNALIKGVEFVPSKLGQRLTEQGFSAVELIKKGWDAKAVWITIEYYAYDSKAKAEGAKQLARTFGQIGIMTTFEKLSEVKPEQPKSLPPSLELKMRVVDKVEYLANTSELPAHMRQIMMDDLFNSTFTQPSLPSSEPLWLGAVQRADELGYRTDSSLRTKLGRYLANLDLDRKKEKRLCNGTMRQINVYKVSKELDDAIDSFFN